MERGVGFAWADLELQVYRIVGIKTVNVLIFVKRVGKSLLYMFDNTILKTWTWKLSCLLQRVNYWLFMFSMPTGAVYLQHRFRYQKMLGYLNPACDATLSKSASVCRPCNPNLERLLVRLLATVTYWLDALIRNKMRD